MLVAYLLGGHYLIPPQKEQQQQPLGVSVPPTPGCSVWLYRNVCCIPASGVGATCSHPRMLPGHPGVFAASQGAPHSHPRMFSIVLGCSLRPSQDAPHGHPRTLLIVTLGCSPQPSREVRCILASWAAPHSHLGMLPVSSQDVQYSHPRTFPMVIPGRSPWSH